ncbi:B12-binding domain-containing protein [Chloroflexota bacterium]
MTMNKEEILKKLSKAVLQSDEKVAVQLSKDAFEAGIDPLEILLSGAAKGLDEVGDKFEKGELWLPELITSADAMKGVTDFLRPHIKAQDAGGTFAKIVIGTVLGDIHDIGKTIVATMFAVSGLEVYDIGIDAKVKQFVTKAEEVGAKIIAMSSLITMSAFYMEEVINYLKDAGIRDKYYVIVGGSPISGEWAAQIGADGYAKTAAGARVLVKKLLAEGGTPPLSKPIIVQS